VIEHRLDDPLRRAGLRSAALPAASRRARRSAANCSVRGLKPAGSASQLRSDSSVSFRPKENRVNERAS
jgi:hypothetical protein